MRAVSKKALADLIGRPLQALLILLTVAAASGLLYLGLVTVQAATVPYERQLERAHGAHAWFYLEGEGGPAAAAQVAAQSEVTASVLRPVMATTLVLPGQPKAPRVMAMPLPPGEPAVMGYILVEGRELQAAEQDAGLLSASMARYLGVRVGDRVPVATPGGTQAVTVVGLFVEPRTCDYPRCGGQGLYVRQGTFDRLTQGDREPPHWQLGVRLAEPAAADGFITRVRKDQPAITSAGSWLLMLDWFKGNQALTVVPVLLFGLVASLASGLILMTIIGGAVLSQHREIAVLKALGFTGGHVLLLYLGQSLLLGLVGAGLGVVGGHLLATRTLLPLAQATGTPEILHMNPGVAAAVLVAILAIAALCAALAARPAVVSRPAAALADGYAAPRARQSRLVRWLTRLGAPVPLVLGVKDAQARPARAALTVGGLLVCVLTVSLAVIILHTGYRMWEDKELLGIHWEMTVEPFHLTPEQAEAAIQARPEVARYFSEVIQQVTVVGREFPFLVRGVAGDLSAFDFRVVEGRMVSGPDEIMLGLSAWRRLDAHIGMPLMLQVGDRTRTLTVVGRYQDSLDMGRVGMMTGGGLTALAPSGGTKLLRVKFQPGTDLLKAQQALLADTQGRLTANLEDYEIPPWATDLIHMVRLLAAVMVAVAALSALGAALLTAREQAREVGIRKALGMTPLQVLVSMAVCGGWFGLLAVLAAVPLSVVGGPFLGSAMGGAMGLGDLPTTLPPLDAAVIAVGGVVLAAAAALPAALWAAQVATARVLQAE